MKNFILIFGLIMLTFALQAQEANLFQSNIEQFIKAPGKTINGYTMCMAQPCADRISLMKYIEPIANDSMYGVIFNGNVVIGGGDCSVIVSYKTIIDYKEVTNIINWIEFMKKELNKNSMIDYISFTPKKGKLLLFIERVKTDFAFKITYDILNSSSTTILFYIQSNKSGYNFRELDAYCNQLKKIQKVIDENIK